MTKTFKNATLWGFFATVVLFIFSFYLRRLHVDEAVLADPAYWLSKDGYLHSEGLRGWQHAEDKFLFTHKLYLYVGALFIKIFGWSAATVKSVSLAYLLGLFAVSLSLFKYLKIDKSWYPLFALLLLSHCHVFELGFVFRPEIAVALCTLATYYLLQKYLDTNSKVFLALAGVVAALGIGHHLNGVIIPGAGCLLLIFNRKWLSMIVFGIIASLGFAIHLLGVSSAADFQMMISQFRNMQDIGNDHFNAFHYIVNILNEQQRYLHSPREMAFTLLFIPALILSRKYLWQNYKSLCVFTASATLCLAIIAHGKDSKYLTLVTPLILLLTTFGFPEALHKSKKVVIGLLLLYIATENVFNLPLTFIKERHAEVYQTDVGDLPEGTKVLAPVYAVFWGTPRYRLQSFISYQFRAAHQDFDMTIEGLNTELDRHDIEYVLFDEEQIELYKPTPENMPKFQLLINDSYSRFMAFKRKGPN